MICIQNLCGKAILVFLITVLVGVICDGIICYKTPFKGLAPTDEVKENLIHIRFNIVLVTKNMVNMTNNADPDETPPCYAASHLGLRYL